MEITVLPNGDLKFIYTDELVELLQEGEATIQRASHVEPAVADPTQWEADMAPSGSTVVLGPFPTRAAALDAEVAWLQRNVL
jgi:hypothetical protein